MNVEQYRKRFYNLMESTMGNVKPLINEEENNDGTFFIAGPWESDDKTVAYEIRSTDQTGNGDCYIYHKTPETKGKFVKMSEETYTQDNARNEIYTLIDKRDVINKPTPQ